MPNATYDLITSTKDRLITVAIKAGYSEKCLNPIFDEISSLNGYGVSFDFVKEINSWPEEKIIEYCKKSSYATTGKVGYSD